MKRIVTYDVKEDNEQNYKAFLDFAGNNGAEKLTESTYLFHEVGDDAVFRQRIRSLFSQGDTVYIIGADGDYDDLFYRKI